MTEAEGVVRQFYAALGQGDTAAALACLSPTIEWVEAERSPYYAGTAIGVDKVVETVLAPIGRDFDNFACTPDDFVSQVERTVSFGFYTGRAKVGGGALRAPFAHVWTVKGGAITRFVQYTDSALWAAALAGTDQAAS